MMRLKFINQSIKNDGFTLVELLIVMLLGGIIMAAVMTSFLSQHKSYIVQDGVVEMHQNLRVVMDMISSDIRSAGYNPAGITNNIGIITATAGRLGFTRDLNGDGDTNDSEEAITYGFSLANDAAIDGIADAGSAPLGRNTGTADGIGGSGFQQLGQNFQAIEFLYVLDDGTQTLAPTAAQLGLIRSVMVSVLAVSSEPDQNFTNSMTYTSASGATWGSPPFNDNIRRRILTTTIKCRNLGL